MVRGSSSKYLVGLVQLVLGYMRGSSPSWVDLDGRTLANSPNAWAPAFPDTTHARGLLDSKNFLGCKLSQVQNNAYRKDALSMAPSRCKVWRVTHCLLVSLTSHSVPGGEMWASKYGYGGGTPSCEAQRKAAWSNLSFSTVPSASVDVSPHGPNCCSQSVCLGRGGGLGTACAPHSLAMWLSFTPGNALSLLAHGRVWCRGLFPVLRKEWTVSPEDCW